MALDGNTFNRPASNNQRIVPAAKLRFRHVSADWHSAFMGYHTWLHGLSDRDLVRLLHLRPDALVGYHPSNFAELADHLCAPSALAATMRRLDRATLKLACELSPSGSPYRVHANPQQHQSAARLVSLGLAWPTTSGLTTHPLIAASAKSAFAQLSENNREPALIQQVELDTVVKYAARATADLLDICELLVNHIRTNPVRRAASGGIDLQNQAHLESVIGCTPAALELCLHLCYAARLIAFSPIGKDLSLGVMADQWQLLDPAQRFQSLLMTWWNHQGIFVARTDPTTNAALEPLAPQVIDPDYRELRQALTTVFAESTLGFRNLNARSIEARLAWHRPLIMNQRLADELYCTGHSSRADQCRCTKSMVAVLAPELDAFGVHVDYAITPLGLALVQGDLAAIETSCERLFATKPSRRPAPSALVNLDVVSVTRPQSAPLGFSIRRQALGMLLERCPIKQDPAPKVAQRPSMNLAHLLVDFPSQPQAHQARRITRAITEIARLDSLNARMLAHAINDTASIAVNFQSTQAKNPDNQIIGNAGIHDDQLEVQHHRCRHHSRNPIQIPLSQIDTVQAVWPASS